MVYCTHSALITNSKLNFVNYEFYGISALSNRHIPKTAFGLVRKWDNRGGFLGYVFGIWLSGSPLKGSL